METPRPTILCVDDDIHSLEALERALRKQFQVIKSTNVDDALEIVRKRTDVAIVVADFRMPKMSGIEFLTKVREIMPDAIRTILSGQIDLTEIVEAVNSAQVHRIILKPWDTDYLVIQMLESLQSHMMLRQRNQLEYLAITDPVTQLTNHRFFQQQIRKEVERADRHQRPVSMLMIDIDHFKSFNDHHGHPEGDRLLANVAQYVAKELRSIDSVSRYGGEEFAVIMPDTPLDQARSVAERLRQNLESESFNGPFDRPVHITISVGVASYPQHGTDAISIIEAADRALYEAKRQGRNQTVVAQQ